MLSDATRSVPRNLLIVLAKGWTLIVGTAVVFGLVALGYSILQKPVYQASTTLFITSGGTVTPLAYDNVKASQERVASYAQVAYSDVIIEPALKSSGLDWSTGHARQAVGVDVNPQIVMLTIFVQDQNAQSAGKFAKAMADTMVDIVAKIEVAGNGSQPTAKLTVISPAAVSGVPVSPNTLANVAMATLLGLFVGALLVLLREALNKKVRDAADAEQALGTPTLALVPRHDESTYGPLADFDGEQTNVSTSFRNLRSRLKMELRDTPHPKILVTSAQSGEGKTTTAINVAAALSQSDSSVVIVDVNIDDPQVVERLECDDGVGLTDVIHGGTPLAEAIQRGTLAVLGTGTKTVDHPDDLFSSAAFAEILDDLAHEFDYVIIDSPALLADSGTEAILPLVDGVVMVVRLGGAAAPDLAECKRRMENVAARALGLVIYDFPNNQSRSRRRIKVHAQ